MKKQPKRSVPPRPTRRVPPTEEDRKRYEEMLACLRVLERVATYYFMTGDSSERQETAKAVCDAAKEFYKRVVDYDTMDCGVDCFVGNACVECKQIGYGV